jgi:hypothetical protein
MERKAISEHQHIAEEAKTEAEEFLALVEETIGDDAALAAEVAQEAKAKRVALSERRLKITRPLLQSKAEVDDLFMPVEKVYSRVEQLAKAVIVRAEEQAEQQRRAALAAASTKAEVTAASKIVAPKPEGVQLRRIPKARIIPGRESDVPAEYWIFDSVLALAHMQRGVEVPGVEIYYETSVALTKEKH